jgi:hypothetical protein
VYNGLLGLGMDIKLVLILLASVRVAANSKINFGIPEAQTSRKPH